METFSIVEEAFVYRAGQRTSSEGYKANEWDLNNPLWTGRVIVQGDGTICIIKLENTSGVLFAECRFDAVKEGPTYVEKVTDSSRYFVLRIENKGRHAFIGLGFNERNSALTFYDGVIEHKKSLERKGELEKIKTERMNQPKVDRSFGDGQTITISFKTKTKQKEGSKKKNNKKNIVQLGNGGLLMPPPGDGPVQQKPNTNNLLFGMDNNNNNNNNQTQTQTQNTNNLLFGNTTPPSSNNNQNTNNLLFGNTNTSPNNNTNNLLFGNTTHPPPNSNPTTNLLFGNPNPTTNPTTINPLLGNFGSSSSSVGNNSLLLGLNTNTGVNPLFALPQIQTNNPLLGGNIQPQTNLGIQNNSFHPNPLLNINSNVPYQGNTQNPFLGMQTQTPQNQNPLFNPVNNQPQKTGLDWLN